MKKKLLNVRHFVALVILAALGPTIYAAGEREFGPPSYLTLPRYCKKIVTLKNVDGKGVDGIAAVCWEIDDRGEILFPDGHTGVYGHRALVAIYLPDHAALAGKPKGTIAFKKPTFLEYGDETSGPYENDLAADDMDGDGDVDLVLLNAASGGVAIFLNDGNGNFPASPDSIINVAPKVLLDEAECADRPFLVTTGNFDGKGRRDIAVEYSTGESLMVAVFLSEPGSVLSYKLADNRFIRQGGSTGSRTYAGLHFRWNSPFYTIGHEISHQERGNVYQLFAAPLNGTALDQLVLRGAFYGLYFWDPVTGDVIGDLTWIGSKYFVGGIIPTMDLQEFQGPFAIAQMDTVNKAFDLILSSGSSVAFNIGFAGPATMVVPAAVPPPGRKWGGIVPADFDQDGFMDLAHVSGDDPYAEIVGDNLTIGYGDGSTSNPLLTGAKIITGLKVPKRWWENPLCMIVGNFTGDVDPKTGQGYQSIMTLGADVASIHPNLGEKRDQLNPPRIDILGGSGITMPGDKVKLSGALWFGTPSEVTELVLQGGFVPTLVTIPRAEFKITPGTPEVLEFTVPTNLDLSSSLSPGFYTITVKNAHFVSNDVVIFIG